MKRTLNRKPPVQDRIPGRIGVACMLLLAMLTSASAQSNAEKEVLVHDPVAYNTVADYERWFGSRSNDQDKTIGMVAQADDYIYGKGVGADRKRGIKILKRAAALGSLEAMRFLTQIHLDPNREFGGRNYLVGYYWLWQGWRLEFAATNRFRLMQVAEVVAAIIALSVVFLGTRYVWRLNREFRRPAFLEPGSPATFAFVEEPEEYSRLARNYREAEGVAGNSSQPIPVLIETTGRPMPVFSTASFWTGLAAFSILIAAMFYWVSDWKAVLVCLLVVLLLFDRIGKTRNEFILVGLDPFWGRVCRWAALLVLGIIVSGFTDAYHWSSHWKLLLACLTAQFLAVFAVFFLREQWLLNRLIKIRRVA